MADTERERMPVVEERGEVVSAAARGFNAGATDCSKPLVHDSSILLPCESVKDEDIAATRSSIAAADSLGMKTQHLVESLETRLQSALMRAVMQILDKLGKDAAARVITAERKASVMEREHINTKQQALAMMLRIKHSSDSMLIDAEKRLLVEKRRSQELDAKVGTLQDTIRRMKAELKRRGDIQDELQRSQLEAAAAARAGLMSPSEAVSKKRKGNHLQVRLSEGKPGQPSDQLPVEDECDDTATLLAGSPSTDRPNSLLGPRGLGQSTHRNSTIVQAAPAINKQGSPAAASLRKSPRDGSAQKTYGHRLDKELNLSAGCAKKIVNVESKGKRAKVATDVEDDSSCDQHDSSVEGLSQNAEKKPNARHDSLVNDEDMDGIDDGFLGLIALQGASPIPLTLHELRNGDSAQGAEAKEGDASDDSSTDDEAEYQSKQQKNAAARIIQQPKSDEGSTVRHKVPETTKSEQPMVLRRSSGRIRRGKQRLSPEISGPAVRDKEVRSSGDTKGAENSKSKGGAAADAADGLSTPLVESSRDSRRLMQGARQLLSLRKV